ncbi:MAG: hypothetical protein AAF467_07260 [Actinomycetota bacterium]
MRITLTLIAALLSACSQEGTATGRAIDSGVDEITAESTTAVAVDAEANAGPDSDGDGPVDPEPLSCPQSGAADCDEPTDLAHDDLCATDAHTDADAGAAAVDRDGSIERPHLIDGSATLTTTDDDTGEIWHLRITAVDMLSGLDDPLVSTASPAPDTILDDNVLVAVAIHAEHEAGPANLTFPPFNVFVVDGQRRTSEQQYNLVVQWSDGLRVQPPTLPNGTNGDWRGVFQVEASAVDGLRVGVNRYGDDPAYYAPC